MATTSLPTPGWGHLELGYVRRSVHKMSISLWRFLGSLVLKHAVITITWTTPWQLGWSAGFPPRLAKAACASLTPLLLSVLEHLPPGQHSCSQKDPLSAEKESNVFWETLRVGSISILLLNLVFPGVYLSRALEFSAEEQIAQFVPCNQVE